MKKIFFALLLTTQLFALSLKPGLGLNISSQKVDPATVGTEYSSKMGLLLGALMGFDLVPGFELEVGAMLVPYGSKVTTGTTTVETTYKMVHLPVIFRLNLIPMLSLGAGGYLGFAMGSTASQTTTIGTAASTTADVALGSGEKGDHGLLMSVAFQFPVAPLISLYADARFLMGLKNMTDVAASSQKYTHLELLTGAKIEF